MPTLQGQDLLGSFVYSDAYMDDDRLVHETLRSANEAGACCVNFVRATGAEFSGDGKMTKVRCRDLRTDSEFLVEASHFTSTVGPWTDLLGESLFEKWKQILRPTKGVHLTFRKDRLPLNSAVVMAAEKRIVFGIPRHEMVIVGTTDTDYKGSPENVTATPEDVEYLLGVVEKYFPGAKIRASDIVATYAGVRPLVQDDSSSEGKTSREHTIFTEDHGVTFVAGGKYTTYRLMAEEVVDECLRFFPESTKSKWGPCNTNQPLNPFVTRDTQLKNSQVQEELLKAGKLSAREARLLVDRHGGEALEIWKKFGPASYWELEAHHAIENTMCLRLVDFFTRRVPLFLSEPEHGVSLIPLISTVFSKRMGWGPEQQQAEEQILADHMRHELAWRHKIQ
jgi:glycerol-3-phosphate dehydrogenase